MRSFAKIKPSRNGKITLSFFDIRKYCLSREFFTSLMSFYALRENKILAKISESLTRIYEHFAKVMLKHLSMTYSVYVSRCGEQYRAWLQAMHLRLTSQQTVSCHYRPVSKTQFTCKWPATIGLSAKRYLHANGVPLLACQQTTIYMQMACHFRPASNYHLHGNGVPISACQQNAIYMKMACQYRPASKTPFTCK